MRKEIKESTKWGEFKGSQKGRSGFENRGQGCLWEPLSVLLPGWVKVWLLVRSVVHLRGRWPGVFLEAGVLRAMGRQAEEVEGISS